MIGMHGGGDHSPLSSLGEDIAGNARLRWRTDHAAGTRAITANQLTQMIHYRIVVAYTTKDCVVAGYFSSCNQGIRLGRHRRSYYGSLPLTDLVRVGWRLILTGIYH